MIGAGLGFTTMLIMFLNIFLTCGLIYIGYLLIKVLKKWDKKLDQELNRE